MSADPRTQFDLVHSFWQQLLVLDQRVLERARRTAARRRMRRTLVFAILALLAAAALAAAGLQLFSRGEDDNHTNPAGKVLGLARLPGTLRIVPTTAPDPDGGPPWALRSFRTENETCFQVGRLVEGKLAVIGINGAFGNDNRYHVLKADPIGCAGLKPGQLAFGSGGTFDSSGLIDEQPCLPAFANLACDREQLRTVLIGGSGPHLVEATLRMNGREVVQTITDRANGTYLFVLRGPPVGHSTIIARFDDGTVCAIPSAYMDTRTFRESETCRRHEQQP
jgi:hypothetical protein